jgi:cellulose synthase/poly-beta-1,6-N-acetylglucosamine synthase-like glycosyltransferase
MTSYIAQIAFWSSLAMLAYIYVGYPLLMYVIGRVSPRPIKRSAVEPPVTVLITAFNEEKAIAAKIENTLAIEYPKEKLEILVASDGSTDSTDAIVQRYGDRGVKLFRQEGRVGKTVTQNNAAAAASGEIILFSDATTEYAPDVLRKLLPSFADSTIGCVAGRLQYIDPRESAVGSGARSYWSYETFLKTAESRACSIIGASGCMYAVRKSAYRPMYAEACSDFLICTVVFRQGLRSVFEPAAVCFEHTNHKTREEMRMRVRVIAQTFTDLWRNRDMMNPLRAGLFAIELLSHKLLRYAVPVFLLLAVASNVVIAPESAFYVVTLGLQLTFYSMAAMGALLETGGFRAGLLTVPLYFVLANAASIVAFFKFLTGERFAAWEPIRESR